MQKFPALKTLKKFAIKSAGALIKAKQAVNLDKYPRIKKLKENQRIVAIYAFLAVIVLAPFIYLSLTSGKKTEAAPWAQTAGTFLNRKQITLVNNSGQTFESGTTYSISINTKDLYDNGKLQADCDDIRIFYQPNPSTSNKLNYYVDVADGAINCSDSVSTKVYFPLQANISNGGEDTNYYFYYNNSTASGESSVDAFDIGSATALMACPFEGDSNCINGDGTEAPTTENGAVRYAGGKSALSFDGVDDYVDIPGTASNRPTSQVTLSLWVKLTGNPNIGMLIINRNGGSEASGPTLFYYQNKFQFWVEQSGGVAWDTQLSSNDNVVIGQWYHVVGTYKSGESYLYVNGVQQNDTESDTGAISYVSNRNWHIGADVTGASASNVTHGYIDDVAIWNVALSASEVSSLYNSGTGGPVVREESIVGLYHFDENGNDPRNAGKAIDDSGYGNHGTITGAKYVAGLVGVDGSADNGKVSSQSYASHKGVFIEEGTTNKITNPSFEHDTYDTNWTAEGGATFSEASIGSGTTDQNALNDKGFQRKIWFDGTLYWASYPNGSEIEFYYSLDGQTWTENTSATISVSASASNYAVVTDSSSAYIFYESNLDIIGRKATSYPGNSFSWDTAQTVFDGTDNSTNDYSSVNAAKDTDGQIWVIALREINGTAEFEVHAKESVNPNDITSWNSSTTLDTSVGQFSNQVIIVPLNSGDMYAVWLDGGTNTYFGCFYDEQNDNRWEDSDGGDCTNGASVDTIANIVGLGESASLVVDTVDYDVHFSRGGINTADVIYRRWDNSAGTNGAWQAQTDIDASGAGGTDVSLSLDTNTGDIYVFWVDITPSPDQVLYTICDVSEATDGCSSSGDWSSPDVAAETDAASRGNPLSNYADPGRIYVMYRDGTGSPYPINIVYIIAPSLTATENTTSPYYKFGSTSAELESASDSGFTTSVDVGNTSTHTLSAYVYNGTSGAVGGTVDSSVAQLIFAGSSQTTTYTDMGGGWWRLTYTGTGVDDSADYGIQVKSGKTIYVDGFQLEEKAYTTTYADGSLGTGYSWSGTDHESPSSREATYLQYANTSNMNASEGSLSFWYKPDWSGNDGLEHTLFESETSAGTFKLYKTTSNVLTFTDGTNSATADISSWARGTWNHISLTWGNSAMNIYVNSTAGTAAGAFTAPTLSGNIRLGDADYMTDEVASDLEAAYGLHKLRSTYTGPAVRIRRSSDDAEQDIGFVNNAFDETAFSSFIGAGSGFVTTWYDQSGNDRDIAQSEATRQPELRLNILNSKPVITFDGTDDYMDTAAVSTVAQPITYFTQFNAIGPSCGGSGVERRMVDGSALQIAVKPAGACQRTDFNAGGLVATNWDPRTNRIVVPVYNGANSVVYRSDGANATGNLGTGGWDGVTLAWDAGNSSSFFVNGDITTHIVLSQAVNVGLKNIIGPKMADLYARTWNQGGLGTDSRVNGQFSDVRTYSSTLTPAQITDLYHASLGSSMIESFSTEQFTDGEPPVLAWNFDESYGTTANDSSRYQNAGTITNAVWRNSGANSTGKYLDFDGDGDYVSKTYSDDSELNPNKNGFSVSLWFRHSSTAPASNEYLVSRYNNAGYKIYMTTEGYICFGIDDDSSWGPDDSACSTTSYADSKWHNVHAVKASTSSITLYVDGVQVAQDATLAATGSISGQSPTLYVGIDSDGSTGEYVGSLDSIKIFNIAHSEASVQANFMTGARLKGLAAAFGIDGRVNLQDGLVGHWKMDEATANSCTGGTNDSCDSSSNGSDGAWIGNVSSGVGKFGNGGVFDGNGDYVNFTANTFNGLVNNSNAVTLSAWINPSTFPANNARATIINGNIATGSTGIYIGLNDDSGFVEVGGRSATGDTFQSITSNRTLTAGNWYHVVGILNFSSDTLSVYINGQLDRTASATFTSEVYTQGSSAQTDSIGGLVSQDYFHGIIDEVRIYRRSIDSTEVKALYEWAPGPILELKMDDDVSGNGQTLADSSGNNNNATTSDGANDAGMYCGQPGKYGKSCLFDGTDDSAAISSNDTLNIGASDFTLEVWVKGNSMANSDVIFAKSNGGGASSTYGFHFGVFDSLYPTLHFATGDTNLTKIQGQQTLSDGQWYHIAISVDRDSSTNTKVYVDGVAVTTTVSNLSDNTGAISNSVDFAIASESDGGFNWDGSIDEVKMYNYALTSKQVVSSMNAGHPNVGSPVGSPLGHWKFDEGYGDTANDSSGHGNNGNLAGTCPGDSSCPTWANNGKHGKALSFDSNDYVDLTASAYGEPPITACLWFNQNNANVDKVLFWVGDHTDSTWYAHYITADLNGKITVTTAVNNDFTARATSTTSYTANNWYHVCGVWESTTSRKIYLNGKLEATNTTSASLSTIDAMYIGRHGGGGTSAYANGLIDDVKLYNYALSSDEVYLEYNQGRSTVLGSISTESDGITASNSASREYCIPGDTSTCNAPVGEWKMDDNAGTSLSDSSGNNNSMSLGASTAAPIWVTGKIGSALSFDGGDYAEVSDPAIFDFEDGQNFTISFWMNRRSFSDLHTVLSKRSGQFADQGYLINIDGSTDKIALKLADESATDRLEITSTTAFTESGWNHITIVYDDSALSASKIYVNGKDDNSTNTMTHGDFADLGSFSNARPLRIGAESDDANGFDGLIDNMRIYNYARTPAQVAWEYNRGAPVVHYKFDECTGTTAYNSVEGPNGGSGGNDGTITIGATGTQTSAGSCESGNTAHAWNNGAVGQNNSGLSLDGTDDYVTVDDADKFTFATTSTNIPFSIAVWVNVSDATQSKIVSKYDDTSGNQQREFELYLSSSDFLKLLVWDETNNGYIGRQWSTAFPENEWHHVVATYNGGTTSSAIKLYVDGQRVDDSDDNFGTFTLIRNTTAPLQIGYDLDSSSSPSYEFSGKMDDVRLYNYELTYDQIKMIMNEGAVSFR